MWEILGYNSELMNTIDLIQILKIIALGLPVLFGIYVLTRRNWMDWKFQATVNVVVYVVFAAGFSIYSYMKAQDGTPIFSTEEVASICLVALAFFIANIFVGPLIGGISISIMAYTLIEHGTFDWHLYGWETVISFLKTNAIWSEWAIAFSTTFLGFCSFLKCMANGFPEHLELH
ncbi:hypothetical protein HYR53_10375 [Candidatus Acetothermia bacterium]|nr:hypothetical protein [Candidatus Acetothermia bacterium]